MHRRESIMAAIKTALTGLTTTGTSVERSRAWPVSTLPALTIAQGEDSIIDDWALDSIGRELSVQITAHKEAGQALETDLNAIAAEVYAAMVADRTLGLAYVFDINLASDSAPDIVGEQDKTQGQMAMVFTVKYQHSDTSVEA